MPAVILDGRSLAAELSAKLAMRTSALRDAGIHPKLAVVIAGEDPASLAYLRNLTRAGARTGVEVAVDRLSERATAGEIRTRLQELGADSSVHGVMLQQPLPDHLAIREIAEAIAVDKDVDGSNPINQGHLAFGGGRAEFVPATPLAVMLLLERSPHWPLRGRRAAMVGRSSVVGIPAAILMLSANAAVTILHSKSGDLEPYLQTSEVVVAAAGVPGLIRGSQLMPGATVIDVGTTLVDGELKGDVDFDSAVTVVGAITPVPGGVGPVTIVALLRNVVQSAEGSGASQR